MMDDLAIEGGFVAPSCDACSSDRVRLFRFALVAHGARPDGSKTTRGAGAINLCERCWKAIRARSKTATGARRLRLAKIA